MGEDRDTDGREDDEKLVDGDLVSGSAGGLLTTGEEIGEEPKRFIDKRWRNGGLVDDRGRKEVGEVVSGDKPPGVCTGLSICTGSAVGAESGKYEDTARGLFTEPAVCGRFGRRRGLRGEVVGSEGMCSVEGRAKREDVSRSECLRRKSVGEDGSRESGRRPDVSLIEVSMLKGDTGCREGRAGSPRKPSEGGAMIGAGA